MQSQMPSQIQQISHLQSQIPTAHHSQLQSRELTAAALLSSIPFSTSSGFQPQQPPQQTPQQLLQKTPSQIPVSPQRHLFQQHVGIITPGSVVGGQSGVVMSDGTVGVGGMGVGKIGAIGNSASSNLGDGPF